MQDHHISEFIAKASNAPAEQSAALLQEALTLLAECEQLQSRPERPSQIPPSKKAVEKVCRGIGHDFNGILANIRGMVEITQMMTTDAPEQVKSVFEKILGMVERGHHASEMIRCYGKVHDCQKTQFELSGLLKRALNDVRIQLQIPFHLICERPDNLQVTMDATQLELLLLQLVNNALEAMKDTSVTMSASDIAIEFSQTDNQELKITVQNKGKAIAVDIGDKVFEPFYTTKKAGKGIGLGLSIAKQIVMNHDGAISYNSSVAEGTCFTCVMPVITPGAGVSQ